MKTFAVACVAGLTLTASAWCQLDPAIELNLMRQQQQNQKQYTQVDLSTDAGRKVYLLEHEPTRFRGTDRDRTLQAAADALAARNSPAGASSASSASATSGGTIYDSLKSSNPSLGTMSESDIRALYYNKFRQEGKSMSEARQLAATTPISANR